MSPRYTQIRFQVSRFCEVGGDAIVKMPSTTYMCWACKQVTMLPTARLSLSAVWHIFARPDGIKVNYCFFRISPHVLQFFPIFTVSQGRSYVPPESAKQLSHMG